MPGSLPPGVATGLERTPQKGTILSTLSSPVQNAHADAEQLRWLLSRFLRRMQGIMQTAAIAADGELLAVSEGLTRAAGRRLGAITFACNALARGTGNAFALGPASKVIMDLDHGYLVVTALNDHWLLGIVATKEVDLGALAYDVKALADQIGGTVTDDLVDAMRAASARS
jgi:uncharacterized protein